ncbi:MAG: TIGR00730 family Rossman fold protein [Deltaproteobacteria bacterium]|nr:TIGR00730 family Rossman fold protein [Deltaproteobacteria bacterium]
MPRVCVFCGSADGSRPSYAKAARDLGAAIASRGWGLVYGGRSCGIMAAVADAALAAGGEAIGVVPDLLAGPGEVHPGLTEVRVVRTMHERKATMESLSDAFVALPGGIGTLDEWFEALSWSALGIHGKPVGLLDVDGYFERLVAFLDHAEAEGFVPPEVRGRVIVEKCPERLMDSLVVPRPD